jgi:hypothetical protein
VQSRTIPTADPLDALDRERFEDMLKSPPFAILAARIAAELERYRGECEKRDGVELHRSQGAAAALRMVRDLPFQILKQMNKPPG